MGSALQLLDNEVHIWCVAVDNVPRELGSRYWQLMSAEEHARNQRYRFEHSRWSDCVTRSLARTVLSHYAPLEPKQWRFEKGEHGKPEIINSSIPLRFNLSHTSKQVVCAVTRHCDVGVDVENTERKNQILDIADRYFSAQEVSDLFALPTEKQPDRFFDYWTLKEAYMKARGEGISLGLGNFSFVLDNTADIKISVNDAIEDQPDDWRFWLFRPQADHRLALAVKLAANAAEPQLSFFQTVPLLAFEPLSLPSSTREIFSNV